MLHRGAAHGGPAGRPAQQQSRHSVRAAAEPTLGRLKRRSRSSLFPTSKEEEVKAAAELEASRPPPIEGETRPRLLVDAGRDAATGAPLYRELDPDVYEVVERVVATDDLLDGIDEVDVEPLGAPQVRVRV